MSAYEYDPTDLGDGKTMSRFYMDIPIPSYLLAIAVGDLAYKEVGPTTGVITETVNVEKYATILAGL